MTLLSTRSTRQVGQIHLPSISAGVVITTGGSIIAPNIETVTLKTSASGAKTISGATFADATNVTITATGSNLIINDLHSD